MLSANIYLFIKGCVCTFQYTRTLTVESFVCFQKLNYYFTFCYRIDFNDPITDKPANLANSAVLRMLEEEERNRSRGGRPSK